MVLSGTLRVLLGLLCLCLRGTEAQGVDQNALAHIISYIQTKYSPREDGQYAVAISVPVGYCSGVLRLKNDEFLKQDNPDAAIKAMKGKGVYEGRELIAATRIDDEKGTSKLHSEYLLLKHPNEDRSPMMNLLKKHETKDRCVIFYTYNSPCIGTCLNKGGYRHILGVLSEVKRPKAFVYNRIFKNDAKEDVDDLQGYLKTIDEEIKLYRCYAPRESTPERNRDSSPGPGYSRNRDRFPGSDYSRNRDRFPGSDYSRNRDRSPGSDYSRNRDRFPGSDNSRNRDRFPGSDYSRNRQRSRETGPRDRTRRPRDLTRSYECHACVDSDEVVDQCLKINV